MSAQNIGEITVVELSSTNDQTGGRLSRMALLAGGAIVVLAGCGSGSSAYEMDATTSLTCDADVDGRQLPSNLGAATFEDNRAGAITACHYLSDLEVPVGTPTELLATQQEVIQQYGFTVDGEFGGLAMLASGAIGGSIEASGGTETERSTLLTFMSTDGKSEQTIVVDSEKIKKVRGGETPTIEFRTDAVVLWNKDPKKSCGFGDIRTCPNLDSIWSQQKQREGSETITKLTNESGGPVKTTKAVEELVSEIIVTLPNDQEATTPSPQ